MENKDIAQERMRLFHVVIDELDKAGIDYWMDQGSLLGLVRDGKFLSWDHDIDMGVWVKDARKLNRILRKKILPIGVRMSILPYVVKMRTDEEDAIPVNIRIYFKKGKYAISEFRSVMKDKDKDTRAKNKLMKKRVARTSWRVSKLTRKVKKKFTLKTLYRLWSQKFLLGYRLGYREVMKTRKILFRVEADFFKKFKEFEVYGLKLSIPERAEEYIQLKYGPEWNVPNPGWIWYEEDGALYSTTHCKRNIGGFFYKLRRPWI